MNMFKPKDVSPGPQPGAPPPFVSNPKPTQQKKSTVPTFLGAGAVPADSIGGGMERGKTLLGQ